MARSVKKACALNSFFAGAINCEVICCVNVGAAAVMPTGVSAPRAANEPAMTFLYMWRGRDIVTMLACAESEGLPARRPDCTSKSNYQTCARFLEGDFSRFRDMERSAEGSLDRADTFDRLVGHLGFK